MSLKSVVQDRGGPRQSVSQAKLLLVAVRSAGHMFRSTEELISISLCTHWSLPQKQSVKNLSLIHI